MSSSQKGEGLTEKFLRARSLVESKPEEAVSLLESVQQDVRALSLFSANETIEDVSTKSMPLLATEHFLAMALVSLPTSPGKMQGRKSVILRSLDLWAIFLEKLENIMHGKLAY